MSLGAAAAQAISEAEYQRRVQELRKLAAEHSARNPGPDYQIALAVKCFKQATQMRPAPVPEKFVGGFADLRHDLPLPHSMRTLVLSRFAVRCGMGDSQKNERAQ